MVYNIVRIKIIIILIALLFATGVSANSIFQFNGLTQFTSNTKINYSGNSITITQQPVNATYNVGSTTSLSVTATSNDSLTYQWYKSPSTIIEGETTNVMSKEDMQISDSGNYFCRISNPYGYYKDTDLTSVAVRADTADPMVTIYYSTSDSENLTFVSNYHEYSLNSMISGLTYDQTWDTENVATSGLRFIQSIAPTNFLPEALHTPTPMASTSDFTTNITSTYLTNFNGQVAPFFYLSSAPGTRKYPNRLIVKMQLVKNGGATTTLSYDGNYYLLDLR